MCVYMREPPWGVPAFFDNSRPEVQFSITCAGQWRVAASSVAALHSDHYGQVPPLVLPIVFTLHARTIDCVCVCVLLFTDICHDLLNLYNDQDDQEVATKEGPSKQAASVASSYSSETLPRTLAAPASLPATTFADMHAKPSDQQQQQQQQPDLPPLPPPPGTCMFEIVVQSHTLSIVATVALLSSVQFLSPHTNYLTQWHLLQGCH